LLNNHHGPQVSFAAWGQRAAQITANHSLTMGMGNESPLARIYDLNGYVLLLGVGHANNSSFHLGQYRAGVRPVIMEGGRFWKTAVASGANMKSLTMMTIPFPKLVQPWKKREPLQSARLVWPSAACLCSERPLILPKSG
jgi:aminoglycoside 3-N-acetyltransferase